MRRINYVKCLPLVAVFFASFAYADVELKDNSELLGKWALTAESIKLDGGKKVVSSSWEFKSDGSLISVATDSLGRTKEMTVMVKYIVEDGLIKKQVSPGREKYESCSVVQKTGSDMIVRCTNLFLFLTKK
ncbi:hypothetical protein LBMAG43_00990 [Methylococcaceae bacterium]|jgi:hypothetical protein|nr:hypothetical protein [Methylococcales bacterium]GDX84057.1 hypothetical protein LBMAG43_00990 [Methylococcaceae bacterium]